jgi:hypothetical protein
MARRWNKQEEKVYRRELRYLYVVKNFSIHQVSELINISESAVYDRLQRLHIPTQRKQKLKYNNQNTTISIPSGYSSDLAEFVGILLGDGHLTLTQVTVTLGNKELAYVKYVADLMERLFHQKPKIVRTKRGDYVVYLGSTVLVKWLLSMGMAHNKVLSQVTVPGWCYSKQNYMKAVLRGLLDTDGSIYKMHQGMQISFCNRSKPMLHSVRLILLRLGFRPSKVGEKNVYLTRKADVARYAKYIGFANIKHQSRFKQFSGHGRFV